MSDPFSASRLPDLPNAGYASRRQKETSDAIMVFMRGVERDRMLLLSIVVDGLDKWIKTSSSAWKGLLIDREILTGIFRYFEMQAGEGPAQQLIILHGQQEQSAREQWDKRLSTKMKAARNIQGTLSDLKREQKRLAHRKTFS